jgi:hypothetical protein
MPSAALEPHDARIDMAEQRHDASGRLEGSADTTVLVATDTLVLVDVAVWPLGRTLSDSTLHAQVRGRDTDGLYGTPPPAPVWQLRQLGAADGRQSGAWIDASVFEALPQLVAVSFVHGDDLVRRDAQDTRAVPCPPVPHCPPALFFPLL